MPVTNLGLPAMQTSFRIRFLALVAALPLVALADAALAQSQGYIYRIPIAGLAPAAAAPDNPEPVAQKPAGKLQALTSTDFGSSFTHALLAGAVQRQFVFTNLGQTPARLDTIDASGNGLFVAGGGSCYAGLSVDAGSSCTVNVGFQSTESTVLTNGELRLSGDIENGSVALNLSATAITAFRDSISGQAAIVSADRLTASWGTGSSAGTMRAGVGQTTGRRYVELVVDSDNVVVGVTGSLSTSGDIGINFKTKTLYTTKEGSPAKLDDENSFPKTGIKANDRIGLAVDLPAGELNLYVNCDHVARVTNVPTEINLAIMARKPDIGAQTIVLNAGSSPFGCPIPPAGYKAGW